MKKNLGNTPVVTLLLVLIVATYTEVFTVNITTVDTLVLPEYFGLVSGRKENKIEKAGVHVTCYEFVNTMIINEYPLTLEY